MFLLMYYKSLKVYLNVHKFTNSLVLKMPKYILKNIVPINYILLYFYNLIPFYIIEFHMLNLKLDFSVLKGSYIYI